LKPIIIIEQKGIKNLILAAHSDDKVLVVDEFWIKIVL
jgi:hypothetical protein